MCRGMALCPKAWGGLCPEQESHICPFMQTVQCAQEQLSSPPRPGNQAAGSVNPKWSEKVRVMSATAIPASAGFWDSWGK